jgi:uncharacterized protein YukE
VGGKRAALAYACYDYLNTQYFAGQVPVPLVIWTPTPYGGCIGLCHPTTPPLIRLNPTLLKQQDGRVRGLANTCDTILHEMMHAYIDHVLGGWQGRGQESSHSNDLWVSECNRIAPRLGLQLVAARNKVRRVPLEDAPATKSGKRPTRVERLTTGTLSAGSSQPASPAVSFDREAAGVLDGPHFHGPPGNAHADKHHMCGPRRM